MMTRFHLWPPKCGLVNRYKPAVSEDSSIILIIHGTDKSGTVCRLDSQGESTLPEIYEEWSLNQQS